MKFTISREALLKPLQLVAGVVERRQTLPVLSNVLLRLQGSVLSLTGTDLEVELLGTVNLDGGEEGETTVPARKLLDICRSLPEAANLNFSLDNQKVTLSSGKSRFTLSTLPASDFPSVDDSPSALEFSLKNTELKRLIDRTAFSMAQQDVRYYLNGMLFEISENRLRTVATDGHRLALCTLTQEGLPAEKARQVILPRKGVLELQRLLGDEEAEVSISLGSNHFRARLSDFTFTSKLVDGKFPDYDRVLPKGGNKEVLAERGVLRQAFSRAAILSNEKFRGVRVTLSDGVIKMVANNPEQEEAEEQVEVDYAGDSLEIGFNVSYLVEVLGVLNGDNIKITLSDTNSSALLEETEESDSLYVVMPMRL